MELPFETTDIAVCAPSQDKIEAYDGIYSIMSDANLKCSICLLLISHSRPTDPVKMTNLNSYVNSLRETDKVRYNPQSVAHTMCAMITYDLEGYKFRPVDATPDKIDTTSMRDIPVHGLYEYALKHCYECEKSLEYGERELHRLALNSLTEKVRTEDLSVEQLVRVLNFTRSNTKYT